VTRLTHTLEVSQIARTIARALKLNEDLTEAIALGHDLGHTPFGHIGEEVLDDLYSPGFRHNEQSLRVVDHLERDGAGLNLTWEVRDGILNHAKTRADILSEGWGTVGTLEGEACKLADIVAYVNHDIGDAIRADLIAEADLPTSTPTLLGRSHSERINTMVCDIIDHSWAATGCTQGEEPTIGMSPRILEATRQLRDFLFDRVYSLRSAQDETEDARRVIRHLYEYFGEREDKLPEEYARQGDPVEQRVVDYIAGMTDQYAQRIYDEVCVFM
jgi:dGTPase